MCTEQQSRSGLGLEAQRVVITQHAERSGAIIVAWYEEAASGARKIRPVLSRAMAHARDSGARLVVAKLDRLSREAAFLFNLLDGGVPIVFCDHPEGPGESQGAGPVVRGVAGLWAGISCHRSVG